MKTIRDLELKGKRALLRCDLNVPLDEEGNIIDDFRIAASIPTIAYALKQQARVILLTHLGDPEGEMIVKLRVDKIQEKLFEYLDVSVTKAADCIGKEIEQWTLEMAPGELLLLENVRFHKEEMLNDENFAKQLALLGDVFINDAFGVSHRAHASVAGIPKYLPSGIGLLFEKELHALHRLLENPKRPVVAIVGGKKVESKLSFINRIAGIADVVLLGNLLAREALQTHLRWEHPEKIVVPVDGIPSNEQALDIGPKTQDAFLEKIRNACTIFWAGPLGMTEEEKYAQGSLRVAEAIGKSNAFSIAGGGNLLAFLNAYHLRDHFYHVSTGGGAMLAFIVGEKLPGLEALHEYDGG
ncbi:MAG: phosphoglycerate kinase [Candidatus Wildermuthbacteria bacterium]|nr:phosphoglycerate kinase [Candidatus Wildermuthbacteria bacterium]